MVLTSFPNLNENRRDPGGFFMSGYLLSEVSFLKSSCSSVRDRWEIS